MREKIIKISDYLIVLGLAAIVFCLPLFFDFYHWGFNVFNLNKIILLRLLLSLVAILFILNLSLTSKINFSFPKKIIAPLSLLALSMLASFLFALNLETAFNGSFGRHQGLLSFLLYFTFFILFILKINNLKKIDKLIIAVVSSSALVSLYGLIQFSSFDLWQWRETTRVFSSLGQPNFLGHFLVLVIPLTIYLIIVKNNIWQRLIYSFILLSQLVCLFLTYSRSAWLAFFVSALVLLIYLLYRFRYSNVVKATICTGLVLMLIMLALALYQGRTSENTSVWVERVLASFDLSSGSVKARLDFWQAGFSIIKDMSLPRLLIGYGPDNSYNLFASKYQASWALNESVNIWPDRAHNLILDTVLHFGVLGLLFYSLLTFVIIGKGVLFLRQTGYGQSHYLVLFALVSLLAYFINNLFSFSETVHYIYFYFILGIIAVLAFEKPDLPSSFVVSIYSRVVIFMASFVFVSLFIFYYCFMPIKADYYYSLFVLASRQEACLDNLSFISGAVDRAPYENFYQEQKLFWSIDCLKKAETKDEILKLVQELSYLVDFLPAKSYNLRTLLNLAEAKSILFFYGQEKYGQLARDDFNYLLDRYQNISEVYKRASYWELSNNDPWKAIDLLQKGVLKIPDSDDSFSDEKHRFFAKIELMAFFNLLEFSYGSVGDEAMANYYKEQALILDNK